MTTAAQQPATPGGDAAEAGLAVRLDPVRPREVELVRRHFPDRRVEGRKGATLALDFQGVRFGGWDGPVLFKDVEAMTVRESFAGDRLVLALRDGGRAVLPLKPFAGGGEDVLELVNLYHSRHLAGRTCRREMPGQEEEETVPPDTAPGPAPTPAVRARAAADPAAGLIIDERYRLDGPEGDWGPGQLRAGQDLQDRQPVHLARAAGAEALDAGAKASLTAVTRLRTEGLLLPQRVFTVRSVRGGTGRLASGDVLLAFRETGGQALLDFRDARPGRLMSLAQALPLLEAVARGLDALGREGLPLRRLGFRDIRVGEGRRIAFLPFFLLDLPAPASGAIDLDGSAAVLDGGYAGEATPATCLAAVLCALLTPPAGRQGPHDGTHRALSLVPYHVNRLLAAQLRPDGREKVAGALAFLGELKKADRPALDVYLCDGQRRRLAERGFDEPGVRGLVRAALAKGRPGFDLLLDQEPRPVTDDELERAISARAAVDLSGRHDLARKLLLAAGACSVLAVCWLWCTENREPLAPPRPVAAHPGAQYQAAFSGSLFSDAFPSSGLKRLPAGARLRYFVRLSGLSSANGVAIRIRDERDRVLGDFNTPARNGDGWAWANVSTDRQPRPERLTCLVSVDGTVVHEEVRQVGSSWFGSFPGLCLALAAVAAGFLGVDRLVLRRMFPPRPDEPAGAS